MNFDSKNRIIQAFPITANTFQGTPTDQACANRVVHVADGGDLTFHYASGDVAITAGVGQDFSVDSDCTGVSSAVAVIIG